MMNMQRSGTGMSAVSTGGLSRTNTGMSVGGGGDIQNTAQDIVGGQGPVFDGGQPYPVLGFGFCATKGRRPHNEDRVMLTPRLGGNSNYNFYGVLDGHAGAQASEFAKNDLPSRLARVICCVHIHTALCACKERVPLLSGECRSIPRVVCSASGVAADACVPGRN